MDDFEVLAEIPERTFHHEDGWQYRCKAYTDVVVIEYWEPQAQGEKQELTKVETFTVPTFCAEQLFSGVAKMLVNIETIGVERG